MNVLLVEDDQWVSECYKAWLQEAGFSVLTARDPQEALDVLDSVPCDVIVLDLLLPGANGVQLLSLLASHSDLMNIPVVICSSAIPQADIEWSAYGVAAVLSKTDVMPQAFIKKITEVGTHAVRTR
ncbi:MAG TPA: response regulator [Candidatus Saccharimonadales bacterium]|nr:response regulator [Candidatus Saccharimonadales bacterium]